MNYCYSCQQPLADDAATRLMQVGRHRVLVHDPECPPHGDTKARAAHLADELGSANVGLVADAYREGWADAINAARSALIGGPQVPTLSMALRSWINEATQRPRVAGLTADVLDEEPSDA